MSVDSLQNRVFPQKHYQNHFLACYTIKYIYQEIAMLFVLIRCHFATILEIVKLNSCHFHFLIEVTFLDEVREMTTLSFYFHFWHQRRHCHFGIKKWQRVDLDFTQKMVFITLIRMQYLPSYRRKAYQGLNWLLMQYQVT